MDKFVRGKPKKVLTLGAPRSDVVRMLEEVLAADGVLIVMERDPHVADEVRRRLQSSGLSTRATVIAGDPRRMLYKLAGAFDIIFVGSGDPLLRERVMDLLAPDGVMIDGEISDGR